MYKFFYSIYKKRLLKKLYKEIKTSLTEEGEDLSIYPGTRVSLSKGSTKEDIVIYNKVSLMGCALISMQHGKICLGNYVKIGSGCKIMSVDSITIGDYTAIATDVTIVDNNNHPINPEYRKYMRTTPHKSDARSWIHSDHKPIKIGKNCWIGSDVRIQKGVTIGDNSIIAACSVVTKDVPANCIAAGNPAKIVKTDIDQIPAPTSCKEFNDYLSSKKQV